MRLRSQDARPYSPFSGAASANQKSEIKSPLYESENRSQYFPVRQPRPSKSPVQDLKTELTPATHDRFNISRVDPSLEQSTSVKDVSEPVILRKSSKKLVEQY